MNQPSEAGDRTLNEPERRSFFARVAAMVIGGIIALFPFAVGWGVVADPLRRGRKSGADGAASGAAGFVRICPLESLPADGVPRPFPVIADMTDAWTRAANQRIGMVFLSHTRAPAGPRVVAFNAECPHLGCFVDFDAAQGRFECPCHESGFDKSGKYLLGPSRRGLDALKVKLIDDKGTNEIWVAFQRFQAGLPERKPVA